MNSYWAIVLGALQGLTEFLPVSSSGHLVIVQTLIPNFTQQGVVFDVVLHAGTLFAVLYYFRKKILKLNLAYLVNILVGTLPAVAAGFLFSSQFEGMFSLPVLVGSGLLITAFFNYLIDKTETKTKDIAAKNSLMIGFFQALAIIPGISRSGATIFAGVNEGIKRKEAAEFSFLLSVPAILGANYLQVAKYGLTSGLGGLSLVLGFITAFISGILAIKMVMKLVVSRRFNIFAVYCFILGLLVIFFF